jgi:hypothetical protein
LEKKAIAHLSAEWNQTFKELGRPLFGVGGARATWFSPSRTGLHRFRSACRFSGGVRTLFLPAGWSTHFFKKTPIFSIFSSW